MNKPVLYTKANGPQRRDVSNFADEFQGEINKMSGCCLDIGSGPGDTAADFILPKLNTKASVVCSDISENMVNFGRENYKDNRRVSFVKLNIESQDLPENLLEQFDHVTSFYCLHWCQDMRQAFENIFNLLRPGGTAILAFLANWPSIDAYKELAEMPCYESYLKDADRYIPVFQHSDKPREDLKALMRDTSFELRHCSVRNRSFIFDSPDLFRKFVMVVNPFMERIPADLTEKYVEDLFNVFMRQDGIFKINSNNKNEYRVLMMYCTFVVYLKKPSFNNKGC